MIRKLIAVVSFMLFALFSLNANAILSMELTRGVIGAIPIAVVPFSLSGVEPSQKISSIVTHDLKLSGRFKVFGKDKLTVTPSQPNKVPADYFKKLGTDHVVIGSIQSAGVDRYKVEFQLLDLLKGNGAQAVVLSKKFTASGAALRGLGHRISDLIYENITGARGIFSTKLAYVVVKPETSYTPRQYILEVADADGYDPRPLLTSNQPIMSPAWSSSGQKIAYVSFEKRRAAIYIQDVRSGKRSLLSVFPGINGAPSWSHDDKKIALVLSKAGSPNIYVMDIATKKLISLTKDYYINTEPTWSPDGKSLLFTSNRGGGPQIYKVNLASKQVSRVTYDGPYNARPSFTQDGGHIALIHRVKGIYKIGVLDLDSGRTRVLTSSAGDAASPSIAPNGEMILYDTVKNDRNVLGMVSADGRVQVMLPARDGEAQDPAWSPFIS